MREVGNLDKLEPDEIEKYIDKKVLLIHRPERGEKEILNSGTVRMVGEKRKFYIGRPLHEGDIFIEGSLFGLRTVTPLVFKGETYDFRELGNYEHVLYLQPRVDIRSKLHSLNLIFEYSLNPLFERFREYLGRESRNR